MVGDVLSVSGCHVDGQLGAISVVYREDGRPRSISPPSEGLSAPCAEVMTAIGAMTLAPETSLATAQPVAIVMPFAPAFVECSADPPDAEASGRLRASESEGPGHIQAPKKTAMVNPVYPEGAKRAGVEGTVILDAEISRVGCMRSLEVLYGGDPRLDASAIQAVSQWRYTPTLLDGKAVPVMMTISVNFHLH
jgi:protein TonB